MTKNGHDQPRPRAGVFASCQTTKLRALAWEDVATALDEGQPEDVRQAIERNWSPGVAGLIYRQVCRRAATAAATLDWYAPWCREHGVAIDSAFCDEFALVTAVERGSVELFTWVADDVRRTGRTPYLIAALNVVVSVATSSAPGSDITAVMYELLEFAVGLGGACAHAALAVCGASLVRTCMTTLWSEKASNLLAFWDRAGHPLCLRPDITALRNMTRLVREGLHLECAMRILCEFVEESPVGTTSPVSDSLWFSLSDICAALVDSIRGLKSMPIVHQCQSNPLYVLDTVREVLCRLETRGRPARSTLSGLYLHQLRCRTYAGESFSDVYAYILLYFTEFRASLSWSAIESNRAIHRPTPIWACSTTARTAEHWRIFLRHAKVYSDDPEQALASPLEHRAMHGPTSSAFLRGWAVYAAEGFGRAAAQNIIQALLQHVYTPGPLSRDAVSRIIFAIFMAMSLPPRGCSVADTWHPDAFYFVDHVLTRDREQARQVVDAVPLGAWIRLAPIVFSSSSRGYRRDSPNASFPAMVASRLVVAYRRDEAAIAATLAAMREHNAAFLVDSVTRCAFDPAAIYTHLVSPSHAALKAVVLPLVSPAPTPIPDVFGGGGAPLHPPPS